MMEKYKIALDGKGAQVQLLYTMLKEYNQKRRQIFEKIQDACRAARRLEEIALGTSLLASVEYIDRLIDSERMSNKLNKENR